MDGATAPAGLPPVGATTPAGAPRPRLRRTGVAWRMVQREVLTWQRFDEGVRSLAATIKADGFRPDIVLPVARGGLVLAGALSYALNIKNVHVINVMFYTGVDERLAAPVVLPPVPNAVDLADAKVLIVDDVADTGETLKLVRKFCAGRGAQDRCAVLYRKPRSVVTCEYVWSHTDLWIDFPWSSLPPTVDDPHPLTAAAAPA
jgi:hypoxanthine phosphoribosyltransferase